MVEPGQHVKDEELERYSLAGADGEEFAQLEEHLLICEACRTRLEEYDVIAHSMAGAAAQWRSEHPRSEPKRRLMVRLLLPLAAVLLLVLGAVLINPAGIRNHEPAVAVALIANRGAATGSHAPARQPLDLRPDLTGVAPFLHYDLEVVDRVGGKIARERTDGRTPTRIPGLQSGMYFVRLYSPSGDLLREYALAVSD